MVKRKHLSTRSIILLSVIFIYRPSSYASAWLPEPGSYKYLASFSVIDKTSQKKRDDRSKIFVQIQNAIYTLDTEKNTIRKFAENQDRELLNSEIRDIEKLDMDIQKLEEDAKTISAFSDDKMAYFEVEYGATDTQSFGLKLGYKTDKFAAINNRASHQATKTGKDLDIFYKYKLFSNDGLVVTLQPLFHYATYSGNNCWHNLDMKLLIGYSNINETRKYTTFCEMGIAARKYFRKEASNKVGYTASMLEGIEFTDGVIFSNYTEYERTKFTNFLYTSTVYDQISVAKEFYFDNLRVQNFTVQIGYFWKGSMADHLYTISGPIFSLWFDL